MRFIVKYKPVVVLMINILRECGSQLCINKCTVHSLRCSRKFDFDGIRFWNSCIIAITPLLGDRPWYDVDRLIELTRNYGCRYV